MSLDNIVALRASLLHRFEGKKLLLWGAGPHVGAVVKMLASVGCDKAIVGLFDSTRPLAQSPVEGIPILTPLEIRKLSHDDHIVIGCAGLNELYGYIVPEHLFYFRIIHRRALETCLELEGRLDEVQNNIDLFGDDDSRQIYLKRLELMLSSVMFMESFKSVGGPYAQNDLVPAFGDRWFYAGAYNGKHLDRALELKPGQAMVAVEPSLPMYRQLKERFADRPQIAIHNYLLWSETGQKLKFIDDDSHQGLAASVFIPDEFGKAQEVETITIDDLLDGQAISDLALDVEGSERMAIAGAQETIARHGPNVAVCLYHNLDDYIKLPGQVNAMMDAKTLAVRQHSSIPLIETVLYALPR